MNVQAVLHDADGVVNQTAFPQPGHSLDFCHRGNGGATIPPAQPSQAEAFEGMDSANIAAAASSRARVFMGEHLVEAWRELREFPLQITEAGESETRT